MARSLWTLAGRVAVLEVAVPIGAAIATGVLVASLVPPAWRAAGQPWFEGHAKNVEQAGVAAGLLLGGATRLLVHTRRGRMLAGLLAAIGTSLVLVRGPAFLFWSGPEILLGVLLATSLSDTWFVETAPSEPPLASPMPPALGSDQAQPRPARASPWSWSRWAAPFLIAVLAAQVGVLALSPLPVDVFHDGEVLSSAVDLVQGGRPFETFLWPHGLHDTGLAALWILITGKIGTSPVVLARATCAALGIWAAYLLASRLTGSRGQALAVSAALALATFITNPSGEPDLLSVYHLGVLFFVVLGFTVLTSSRAHREFLAGASFGAGYLFRLETGIFGAAAAIAVLLVGIIDQTEGTIRRRCRDRAKALLAFGSGLAAFLILWRLAFGWPGAAWFEYTLLELPRYHRDALGKTASWGGNLTFGDGPSSPEGRVLLGWLIFVLLLLVHTAGALSSKRTGTPRERERTTQIVFLSVFALLATRSALDRSDPQHVFQWTVLPVLGILLVASTRIGEELRWRPGRSTALVFSCVLILSFIRLEDRPGVRGGAAEHGLASSWRSLAEHLSPNPPSGPCGDRMFTPAETGLAVNRRFIRDTCQFQRLLEEHGVTRLAMTHSAPWYQVRFHLPLLTRYFAIARAYTPDQQFELVEDLRSGRPQALLRAHGYRAVSAFDIADELRAPVVGSYLRARRKGVPSTPTPLGELFLWNEAASCATSPQKGDEGPGIQITAAWTAYQPMTGLLHAQGWARDRAGQALVSLGLGDAPSLISPDLEYGLFRPPRRIRPDPTGSTLIGSTQTGWELSARLPPGLGLNDLAGRDPVELVGVAADGALARFRIDVESARVMPPLTGPEWQGLDATVRKAERLGAADRSLACEKLGQPGCGCEPLDPRR